MLVGLNMMTIAVLACAGIMLDLLLGEARRWHPLVGFGRLASMLERRLNHADVRRLTGVGAWLLAVGPITLLSVVLTWWLATINLWLALLAHALMLYVSLGLRSLRDHILPISLALQSGDLAHARLLTGRIVSRDTTHSSEQELAKAGVESLLENGNDAVFATLFWFVIAGGPGAVLFRLANTLDAMWGYRSVRYLHFGWAAARIDDGLNLIPARLTAISYVVLGNTRQAWRCWREQAPQWSSPNAGPVMAAGAGALKVSLGGAAVYDNAVEERPVLGCGPLAGGVDIQRAWQLVFKTTCLWLMVLVALGVVSA